MYETDSTTKEGMPDARTIHVTGQVTMQEAPEFRVEILEKISTTTEAKIVVELGGVDKMDTSGAAVLAEALKLGQSRGRRVLLCSPSQSVLRIFRLAGFEEVLGACCSDPDETWQRLIE
jgi:anti-anti-sigma factor